MGLTWSNDCSFNDHNDRFFFSQKKKKTNKKKNNWRAKSLSIEQEETQSNSTPSSVQFQYLKLKKTRSINNILYLIDIHFIA